MEPNFKLLATESSEGEGSCSTVKMTGVDRFSTLPKDIVHRILSDMEIADLVRLCCVSKPCREFSLSTPSLSFCGFGRGHGYEDDEETCENRLMLVNALDRFLLSRGDSKLQSFYLNWTFHDGDGMDPPCFCVNEDFRIITWIQNALRCKVEKLNLDISCFDFEEEPLVFPSCVFRCDSLKFLKVEMTHSVVKTPSFTFPSNLVTLSMSEVIIQDEGFFKWISCCCKFLKKISLLSLYGTSNIIIESSSLEDFYFFDYQENETCHLSITGEKLETIYIDCYSNSSTVLNIIAPNLKKLILEGDLKNHQNLGELESLEEATISMYPIEDDFDKVYELLCSLCSAKRLILNEATIEAAYRDEYMPAQFDEVSILRLNIGLFTDELVRAVVSLLRGTPILCDLYLCNVPCSHDPEPNVQTSGFDMEYWKMQNLAFVSQVKEVIIELSDGSNGIEFARYILKHAKALEKMVIRYLPQQSKAIQKLKKSKTICNPTVSFEEYKRSRASEEVTQSSSTKMDDDSSE